MRTKSDPDLPTSLPATGQYTTHDTSVDTTEAAPKSQNTLRRRLARGAMWTLTVIAALIVTGLLYQSIGVALDARRYPPPGRLIEVNGRALHINCMGEGSPTVVLDTLSGGISSYWAWIQPELARHTRVCTYDRPNTAWSGATPIQDFAASVESLHTLLDNAGESPPYVLAGHSIGGVYALLFAHQYPREVAGLVLVDSAHPSQFTRYPEAAASSREFLDMAGAFTWLTRLGVARLYFALGGQMDFGDLPPQAFNEVASWWSRPDYFTRMATEIEMMESNYAYADRTLHKMTLGELPLAVVSGDPDQGEVFPGWDGLQQELSGLSGNHIHLYVPGSNHQSLAFNPEHAQATSHAILQVLTAARDGGSVAR